MTLLAGTGWEGQALQLEDVVQTTNCGIATAAADVAGPWSQGALFVNGTAGGWRQIVPSALECRLFWHYKSQGANQKVLYILTADGSIQAKITTDGSSRLKTWRGDEAAALDTGSQVLATNQYYAIEVRFKADDTNGIFQVYVDTLLDIDRTTGDTKQHATDANVGQIMFGGSGYYDDWIYQDTLGSFNNSRIYIAKIRRRLPNGVGSSTQFTRGGTDSGQNWSQVDEVPANDGTDYVVSSNNGDRDLYAFEDLSAYDAIAGVITRGRWQKNDAGIGNARYVCKSGATTDFGSDFACPVAWNYVRRIQETDPNTGNLWLQANFNSAEFGAEVRP